MDITKILSDIKGKVLDATNFDLLKHAYDLQNQNIEQLKNNNEALKESNELLLEKIARVEKENTTLRKKNESLKERVPDDSRKTKLSPVAIDILKYYHSVDSDSVYDRNLFSATSHPKIKIEAALNELQSLGIIRLAGMSGGVRRFKLTPTGCQLLAEIPDISKLS